VILCLKIEDIERVIQEVDVRMGESKCRHTISNLEYIYDSQKTPLIEESHSVVWSGELKNDRGTVSTHLDEEMERCRH